jgi:hypothetical protein
MNDTHKPVKQTLLLFGKFSLEKCFGSRASRTFDFDLIASKPRIKRRRDYQDSTNVVPVFSEGRLIHQEHKRSDPCGNVGRVIREDVGYPKFKGCLAVCLPKVVEVVAHARLDL